MKSRISIEVDFENNNQPVIQILQMFSDDVRDKLIQSFTQGLGGSSWCRIKWVNSHQATDDTSFNRIHITPIKPEHFETEARDMVSSI